MTVKTDGFAFVEFTSGDADGLERLFQGMGFERTWVDNNRDVRALVQGDCIFFVNGEENPFLNQHGASVRAIGVYVDNPSEVLGAPGVTEAEKVVDNEFVVDAPAIRGIGNSLIYLIEETPAQFSANYQKDLPTRAAKVRRVDHMTNIVKPRNLDSWVKFYTAHFGMYEKQYLDVTGQASGMRAHSMVGRCERMSIPITAAAHTKEGVLNQNDEFIRDYQGEGIQHIALLTDDLLSSVDYLRTQGFEFMEAPPDAYYEDIDVRLPGHGLDIGAIRELGILVDGKADGIVLLQIFTQRQIGPVFFEFIERRGEDGFGAGNFKALFESQERDQVRRGSLSLDA